jgi:ariadne-1
MHYWQRWAEHDKAKRSALKALNVWEGERLAQLEERTATPSSQLKFVLDAWKEVLSCRRVLKWTYAVGFYWFDDPAAGVSAEQRARISTHREFFEFIQEEAEHSLERLTDQVENRLPTFLGEGHMGDSPFDAAAWATFREELIGLTDVTRSQFAKLVDFLEKGLEEGLAEYARGGEQTAQELANAAAAAAAAAAGPSSASRVGDNGASWPHDASGSGHPGGSEQQGGTNGVVGGFLRRSIRNANRKFNSAEPFVCSHCTFHNERGGLRCEMCNRLRGN